MSTMELTLTKIETFKLEPYGKFYISMARRPKSHLPHVIDFREVRINYDGAMPFTEQQEKDIVKLMKKLKNSVNRIKYFFLS